MTDRFSRPNNKAIHEYLSGLGRKGASARARKLSAAERRSIARKAALARWKGKKRESREEKETNGERPH